MPTGVDSQASYRDLSGEFTASMANTAAAMISRPPADSFSRNSFRAAIGMWSSPGSGRSRAAGRVLAELQGFLLQPQGGRHMGVQVGDARAVGRVGGQELGRLAAARAGHVFPEIDALAG